MKCADDRMREDCSVLIIEDDADINEVVTTFLSRRGYACTQAFSGSEARLVLEQPTARPFDLVITDLMLPGMSGQELVGLIRRMGDCPIIVISAQSAPAGKVEVFGLGADDYLVKPFDLDELLARVQVQLRHADKGASAVAGDVSAVGAPVRNADVHQDLAGQPIVGALFYKEWVVDVQARTFTAAGAPIRLTRLEYNIMEALVKYPKKAYTKRELFEAAWNEDCFVEEKAINVHISNIRSKLKPTGTDVYIETVWGIGFKLAE